MTPGGRRVHSIERVPTRNPRFGSARSSEQDRDATDLYDAATTVSEQPELTVHPPEATVVVRPADLHPAIVSAGATMRRSVRLEAIVTMADGSRFSFETKKVSLRGLSVSASTASLPIDNGADVGVVLKDALHAVAFDAVVVNLVRSTSSPELVFGLQITKIDRAAQRDLERLLEDATEINKATTSTKTWLFRGAAALGVAFALALMVRRIGATPTFEVERTAATEQSLAEVVHSLPGEVVPHRFATVRHIGSATTLMDVVVSRGDQVEAGQALAQPMKLHAERSRANARLGELERRLEAKRATSANANEVATLEAEVSSVRSQLRRLDGDLATVQDSAPFKGIVADVTARSGEVLAQGAPICELVDTSVLSAAVPFSEQDAARIRRGMKGRVLTPGLTVDAEVEQLGAVVRAYGKGKAVLVEAKLPEGTTLRPGTTATLDVTIDQRTVVAVPEDALVNVHDEQADVWVIDAKDHTAPRRVTLGPAAGGGLRELMDLPRGTEVVRRPPATLISGALVRSPSNRK